MERSRKFRSDPKDDKGGGLIAPSSEVIVIEFSSSFVSSTGSFRNCFACSHFCLDCDLKDDPGASKQDEDDGIEEEAVGLIWILFRLDEKEWFVWPSSSFSCDCSVSDSFQF